MVEHDDIWTQALQEAYASAPVTEVILNTLELRHPSFIDENGQLTAVRVVSDFGTLIKESNDPDIPDIFGWKLRLENDAPVQGGQIVDFVACMFEIKKPNQNENSLPSFDIILDNVSREVMQYLDTAIGYQTKLEVTFREYLASDTQAPSFILGGASLRQVVGTATRITGTAQFADLINLTFPNETYTPEAFRGLVQ